MAKIRTMSPFIRPGMLTPNARQRRVSGGRKARTQIHLIAGIIIDVAAMDIFTGPGSTAIS
jgi:hypothetical protein